MAKNVNNTRRKVWIEKTRTNAGTLLGYTILIVFSVALFVVAFLSLANLS
ncbi:MAG: hypothetical protein KAU62_16640 [Candidatus Heimdallarchaeota archaeon]|nr:hypothetical protein [Candidatus Heimdallarchaeota archaeon]MCK4612785.1 hypothetical protein [Candidatus Heimdallarchaeota archaeon]